MDKQLVENLVQTALGENPELFLVDLTIGADNKISVTIDGDSGVPLNECIRVSRAVEQNLDREEEDFSIDVATPDIAKPLLLTRQYQKNVGRTLAVKTETEKYEGELVEANAENITLQWKAREPKPVGKGKVTVEKTVTLTYQEVKEAKVKILFN